MSETISPAALKALDDGELEALWAGAEDEALQALIIREAARRERCAAERAARHAVNEEWFLFAHAQFLAAEAACRGNLLSRAGIAAGTDPWSLWSGPLARAERFASEELRDFWLTSARVTVMEYAAQVREAQRIEREQAGA
jgi:hypothetical protein